MAIPLLKRWVWVVLFICALYGLGSFMVSFFPTKPMIPRVRKDDLVVGPAATFDRVVLLVIDSLRADFLLTEKSMTFTRSLIEQGNAFAFLAEAVVPTVTMPRLKALTSGTIPVFLDVAFNFDSSSAFTDDNIIDRMKDAGKTVVFYGDDTWLKLFPTQFDRYEGVSSFFVSDTVEVDLNVTRRLLPDLDSSDWTALIGHCLGLDHAGHLSGPHSALTNAKKREVDQLVESIYKRLYSNPAHERTLFVLVSDHGMNERGNHGGADMGEVSSLLVFISPRYQSTPSAAPHWQSFNASQVDLAPTLSILLGLPIPRLSVGRVLLPPLALLSPEQLAAALDANAEQLHAAFDDVTDDPALREHLEVLFLDAKTAMRNNKHNSTAPYETYLNAVTQALQKQLTRFDLPRTYASLVLLALSALAMLLLSIGSPHTSMREDMWTCAWACLLMAIYTMQSYPRGDPLLMAGIAFSGSVLYQFVFHWHGFWRSALNVWDVLALLIELLKNVLLLSSSFVEEEHQTYYYLATTFACFDFVRLVITKQFTLAASPVLWLLFLRVGRAWNQSGNKWLGEADIVKYLLNSPQLLTGQVFLAVVIVCTASLYAAAKSRRVIGLCLAPVWAVFVIAAKLGLMASLLSTVTLARLAYLSAFVSLLSYLLPLRSADLWGLVLSALQFMFVIHRPHNLFLLALLGVAALASVRDSKTRPLGWLSSLTSLLWLGQASFFAFGNTNSMATIDIGGAYTALSGYNPILVALGIFLLMYSGHLLLMPAFVANVGAIQKWYPYLVPVRIPFALMALKLCGLAFYALVLVLMRHHLFIWSVFAPRLLYLLIDLAWESLRCITLLCCLQPEPQGVPANKPTQRAHAE